MNAVEAMTKLWNEDKAAESGKDVWKEKLEIVERELYIREQEVQVEKEKIEFEKEY